jgi:hypothetical protein
MKKKPKSRRTTSSDEERIYTYDVVCTFSLQYSFRESEVEQDPEGAEGDLQPREDALTALENELTEVIMQNYVVTEMTAEAESDNLIGVI